MFQASSSLLKACSPHLTPAPFSICLILRFNPSWVSQFLFLILFYYFLPIFQEVEMAENRLFSSFSHFYGYYQLFLQENKIIHDFMQMTLFLFPLSFFRKIFWSTIKKCVNRWKAVYPFKLNSKSKKERRHHQRKGYHWDGETVKSNVWSIGGDGSSNGSRKYKTQRRWSGSSFR